MDPGISATCTWFPKTSQSFLLGQNSVVVARRQDRDNGTIRAPTGRLRAVALGVIRRGGEILVFEGYDPTKRETFFRPLGGSIEFGEQGAAALARELREELGVDIDGPRYLGTLENLFVYDGRPGHEICLIYEAAFIDRSLYERDRLDGVESEEESGGRFQGRWKPLSDFASGGRLYPDGLLDLIRSAPHA